MLANVLRQMVQDRLTTPTEISELAGVSISTVYRWMNGQSHPGFDSIRLLIRHLSNPEAQRSLLTALLAGTAWRILHSGHHSPTGTDSPVDTPRTMNRVLNTLRESSTVLTLVHDRLSSNPHAREPIVHALPVLAKLLDEASQAQRALQHAYEQQHQTQPGATARAVVLAD